MTIASEIQRLQWAKASARTSIINKWVNVPASAKLDTYPWYIDQINTWWPAGWIISNKVLRAWEFYVGSWQSIGTNISRPISYVSWDYMFLLTTFPRWRNGWGNYKVTMCVAFTPSSDDYIQSYYEDRYANFYNYSSEEATLVWLKISESGNTVTFESCYWLYKDFYADTKYFYHTTWTFNKQTNQFWNWTNEYTAEGTTTNPYFEWYIWDQWYYTVEMERINFDYVAIQKFTPTFS